MQNKKIRPIGEILLEAEELIDEAIDSHDVQDLDILNWVYGHLRAHREDCAAVYESDDSYAVFLLGHKDDVKRRASKL